VFGQVPIVFACQCSQERTERALSSLGVKDLEELLAEGKAEVVCQFCGDRYEIGPERLKALIAEKRAG